MYIISNKATKSTERDKRIIKKNKKHPVFVVFKQNEKVLSVNFCVKYKVAYDK